jgi:hypothetical protein
MTLHQNHYMPNSVTQVSSRQYFTGQMFPFGYQADGLNVDVTAAIITNDAGTAIGLFTGTIPETSLFTFDPGTDLKQVPLSVAVSSQSCAAALPGKFVALLPGTSGMDLYVVDTATATIAYSLTGASNLLPTDTAIVSCGIGTATVTSNLISFEVVWTENVGGGSQNLFFAPLQCTIQ